MSAEEVLTAFRRDAPYLFLGAAFAALGMVSATFAVLRRQRDLLLICFACPTSAQMGQFETGD